MNIIKKTQKKHLAYIALAVLFLFIFSFFLNISQKQNQILTDRYIKGRSDIIYDRQGLEIQIKPNQSGNYAIYKQSFPENFKKLLLAKEDKYFYFHPGINPFSLARYWFNHIYNKQTGGSSTITQQLVKILLGQTGDRSIKNKIKETYYSIVLEIFTSKEKILEMYLNSIYLGNNTQGLEAASRLYFAATPSALTDKQILQLLATINNPTYSNPFTNQNIEKTKLLGRIYNIETDGLVLPADQDIKTNKDNFKNYYNPTSSFEIGSLGIACGHDCRLTIDKDLTDRLRQIVKRNLESLLDKNTTNAALVVLAEPQNELLAIIGSPDPTVNAYGYKMNLAIQPRPIGSTIKPFLYLQGFSSGLRPYTKVIDQEYKYTINDGFAFYPKNYDYKYHGEVDLHYSLSNSLNVPSIKVLDYVGQDDFIKILKDGYGFRSLQNLDQYGLGLALGGVEMDLLSLSYYFSIFPNGGRLHPLILGNSGQKSDYASSADMDRDKKINEKKYIALINKILSDRLTGVEQFGLKSSLNLPASNYAVKTGTSREYHDSWTVGYTPDFVVGVWVGNSDNTPMDRVSGQLGAGKIWQEAMNLLLNSKYNRRTTFNFATIKSFTTPDGLVYGLPDDDFNLHQNLLLDNQLILKPHNNDVYLLGPETKIVCRSAKNVLWIINGRTMDRGKEYIFEPSLPGNYSIAADDGINKESILILVKKNN